MQAPTGWSSSIGSFCGSPYTVAEEEKMMFLTLCSCWAQREEAQGEEAEGDEAEGKEPRA